MNIIRNALLCLMLAATQAAAAVTIEMQDSIVDDWQPVIDAIVEHESGGNVNAVNGRFVGPMQIAPILVKECNNILRAKGSSTRYTLDDRRSLEKSREMFLLIMEKYNRQNSFEVACRLWKAGLTKTYSRATLYFIEEMKVIMRRQAARRQSSH